MSRGTLLTISLAVAVLAVALPARPPREPAPPAWHPRFEMGLASFYGATFQSQRTASGERFDVDRMTAAHRTLPFGTRVRVTNLRNGRSAVVRINDRGPWKKHRVIDVSYAAGRRLGLIGTGTARVRLDVLASYQQR